MVRTIAAIEDEIERIKAANADWVTSISALNTITALTNEKLALGNTFNTRSPGAVLCCAVLN